ncbi:MAG: hypothetical protein ACUVR8_07845 [Acidobacteriota bacterium]
MPESVDASPTVAFPLDEVARLEGRAMLALTLSVGSVLVGWLCTLPLGLFALFLAIQSEAGILRLEDQGPLPEVIRARLARLQYRVRWSMVLGAIGTLSFLVSLIRFLWLYLSSV